MCFANIATISQILQIFHTLTKCSLQSLKGSIDTPMNKSFLGRVTKERQGASAMAGGGVCLKYMKRLSGLDRQLIKL